MVVWRCGGPIWCPGAPPRVSICRSWPSEKYQAYSIKAQVVVVGLRFDRDWHTNSALDHIGASRKLQKTCIDGYLITRAPDLSEAQVALAQI
jgi:hypothetical protein